VDVMAVQVTVPDVLAVQEVVLDAQVDVLVEQVHVVDVLREQELVALDLEIK
jgi:hypothetical protein